MKNTKRRITIGFNVMLNVQSVIADVTKQIDAKVQLPTGYYVKYGGQFENLQAAKARLAIAVPVALLLIFVLLFFISFRKANLINLYSGADVAHWWHHCTWLRGMNFSIYAGVGFIALFGIAVLNGIAVPSLTDWKRKKIIDITERVLKGLHTRLRPVIMTAAVASLGFLPMALSTSAGAEVPKTACNSSYWWINNSSYFARALVFCLSSTYSFQLFHSDPFLKENQ